VKSFVLDASIVLAWFVDPAVAPLAAHVRRLLVQGNRALVPHLWRPEVANGFVIAQRRGVLTASRSAEAFAELDLLLARSIETASHDLSIQRVVTTAQSLALTAYDATYLETARRERLPLATLDRALARAATQAGVPLLH
jgi:predicted nucleic acid-binding protein